MAACSHVERHLHTEPETETNNAETRQRLEFLLGRQRLCIGRTRICSPTHSQSFTDITRKDNSPARKQLAPNELIISIRRYNYSLSRAFTLPFAPFYRPARRARQRNNPKKETVYVFRLANFFSVDGVVVVVIAVVLLVS